MAKSVGSVAKSSSRRCFTLVRVATPPAPRTPLPTKFAVAEKHMAGLLPSEHTITRVVRAFAVGTCLKVEHGGEHNIDGKRRPDDSRMAESRLHQVAAD